MGDCPPGFLDAEAAVELEQATTMRTTKETVTFARPFRLGELSEQFPAGRYSIETDEELLEGGVFFRLPANGNLDAAHRGSAPSGHHGICHD